MDTPTIAEYYREPDAMKRKQLLLKSIELNEDPEANKIRLELWNTRYKEQIGQEVIADQFLKFWMTMEFNKDSGNRFFGTKSAKKSITKDLNDIHFHELLSKGEIYENLLYLECVHLVSLYMDLCETDKTYNTYLLGIMTMKKDSSRDKLRSDIYKTAVELPRQIGMEKELSLITKAAREAYSRHFTGETMPE